MSLAKSQIVTVLESKRGSEWWKVQDTIGRRGYYPAHYLKMIQAQDSLLNFVTFCI